MTSTGSTKYSLSGSLAERPPSDLCGGSLHPSLQTQVGIRSFLGRLSSTLHGKEEEGLPIDELTTREWVSLLSSTCGTQNDDEEGDNISKPEEPPSLRMTGWVRGKQALVKKFKARISRVASDPNSSVGPIARAKAMGSVISQMSAVMLSVAERDKEAPTSLGQFSSHDLASIVDAVEKLACDQLVEEPREPTAF